MLALVPAQGSSKLAKLFQFSAIIKLRFSGIYGLVLQDTRHISQLAQAALQASPEFNSMVSCVAGRWCLILITGNLVRNESALKNYSLPFFCMLYVLRVYQLAFSATPNMLPLK